MEPETRVSALLELAKQHATRGRELEDLEWRVNFSLWALLTATAYLWMNAKLKAPGWMLEYVWALPLGMLFVHAIAMYWFAHRSKEEGQRREDYKRDALKLLGFS